MGFGSTHGVWLNLMGFGSTQWGLGPLNGVWVNPMGLVAQPNPCSPTAGQPCDRLGSFCPTPQYLRVLFDPITGLMKEIQNLERGIALPVTQSFYWSAATRGAGRPSSPPPPHPPPPPPPPRPYRYNASIGNEDSPQASGAYIFRPNSSHPIPVAGSGGVSTSVVKVGGRGGWLWGVPVVVGCPYGLGLTLLVGVLLWVGVVPMGWRCPYGLGVSLWVGGVSMRGVRGTPYLGVSPWLWGVPTGVYGFPHSWGCPHGHAVSPWLWVVSMGGVWGPPYLGVFP